MALILDCLSNDFSLLEMYNSVKQKAGDAGYDLIIPERLVVPAGSLAFTIDFKVRCEPSSSFFLVPRSSISKTPLRMSNSIGIIDAGYRGNLMAKVDNLDDEDFVIEAGTRLFQICFPSLATPTVCFGPVSTDTERGTGGFGSTG